MPIAPQLVGVLYINNGQSGFQEKYYLNTLDRQAAIVIMKRIAWARTAFFATDTYIAFGRISSVDSRRDGTSIQLPWPLRPHPTWLPGPTGPVGDVLSTINDKKSCIQMRFETSDGSFWERYLRLIPDTWSAGNQVPIQVLPYLMPLDAGVPIGDPAPGGGLTHLAVCKTYWSLLIRDTYYLHTPRSGAPEILPFQFIAYAQVTSKKIGRAFRTTAGRLPKAG